MLFDWNGTLVDDRDRAWQATAAALRDHLPGDAPMPSPAAIARAWCLPLSRFLARLGVAEADAVAAERSWNRQMARRPVTARPGAPAVLSALRDRGIDVGVISAGSPSLLAADLTATSLAASLDYLCAGAVDKATSIAPFVDRHGPGRVVYVGDTEEDLHAANRAGAIPIAILGGYRSATRLRTADPHAIVNTLDDLPTVIDALFSRHTAPMLQPAADSPETP